MPQSGFAVKELVACAALSAIGIATICPSMAAIRVQARGPSDQAQLGLLIQGFHTFATANNGSFPIPSRIDTANTTISTPPVFARQKDNTGNIFSIMIYSGYVTPEQLVSPAESNIG